MKYIYIEASRQKMEDKYPLTRRQINFFKKYETTHENYVKKNAIKLAKKFPEIATQLLNASSGHDDSKWGPIENFSYIWRYSNNNLGVTYPTDELYEYVRRRVTHHQNKNKHHPEYWINRNKLDKMPPYELAHMVCDWGSVSKQLHGDLHNWWKYNASRNYNFTEEQRKLIKKYIDALEQRR